MIHKYLKFNLLQTGIECSRIRKELFLPCYTEIVKRKKMLIPFDAFKTFRAALNFLLHWLMKCQKFNAIWSILLLLFFKYVDFFKEKLELRST
jgi:hypothetical protein